MSKTNLGPGDTKSFWTRPVGLTTYLFFETQDHDCEAIWHIELCCQEDHTLALNPNEQRKIDISSAAGALVTVRNEGWASFSCWSDY